MNLHRCNICVARCIGYPENFSIARSILDSILTDVRTPQHFFRRCSATL